MMDDEELLELVELETREMTGSSVDRCFFVFLNERLLSLTVVVCFLSLCGFWVVFWMTFVCSIPLA